MKFKFSILFFIILFFFFNNNFSLNLNSNVGLVIDLKTDNVIYEKSSNKIIYPASTTKILTAILVIENLDLNDKILITKEYINLIPYNSSIMGIDEGDLISVKDLLYGLLVKSGNDAAIVFAYNISGSIEEFSKLMNTKAKEIGCNNSNFINPHGYFNENHYSTAKDMTKIMKYALQYDIFKEIIKTDYYYPEYTKYFDNFKNTNYLLHNDNIYNIFGKTGFTDESGSVFIGYSNYNNIEFIISTYDGIYNNNYNNNTPKDIVNMAKYAYNTLVTYDKIKNTSIKIDIIDKNLKTIYRYNLYENIYSYFGDKRINYLFNDLNNIELITKFNNIKFTEITKLKLFKKINI